MFRSFRYPIVFSLILLCSLAAVVIPQTHSARISFSTPEQISEDFKNIPCKNEERLAAVRALFIKMGAAESDLLSGQQKNVRNLFLTRRGATEEKIIIGAHYDKAADGCGAIDNWSGIVTIAHLYRTLKDVQLRKTLVFAAFDKEEKGLVGAREMAEEISKEQLAQYCAMINIDSTGLGAPQVLHNVSSPKLEELAEAVAKRMELPFGKAGVDSALADSAVFLERKIPAVTIHGLAGDFTKILHTKDDKAVKINPESVYLTYRLALAVLVQVDQTDCQAWRETKKK
ncbi:MAG TPA: M20/M25/M40 family metallo-hydrolase [Blastocatellia bacterium]|nr:M20/M25/M40 family metallo-hydrolase [Blastocatellia bacterium]